MSEWKVIRTQAEFDNLPEGTLVRYWDSPNGIIGTRVRDDDDIRVIKDGKVCDKHGRVTTKYWVGWKSFEYLTDNSIDEETKAMADFVLG